MTRVEFEWDPAKDSANRRKHRVSFEEAASAFSDEHGRLIADPDHSDGEDRYVLLGMSIHARILVVVHCYRESDAVIRIISARRATRREHRQYADQR
jgi:uncharacterized DUF497 family protein